ncbi:TetR/AcrR family transcriptional regulator [Paraburkholderia tropica]|uniref:TetR/AcrR family transcriptional regulator n=1 Tax=Paraburkholderia tropica TaxID=92647 RepID=UPI002AB2C0EF|nr:TetR/AcrR family transcriptional regulator [Paraburkholderia tropica]
MCPASSPSASAENVRCGPGRPPLYSEQERTRRVLDAAEQVFTTLGYGAATMEEIARTASMSKRTLYSLYPDKQRLLGAVTVAADDFPWEDADRVPLADPVAELRHRLLSAAEFALNPRQIRLTRLLISEAEHLPDLADNFYDRVMLKCQTYVAAAVGRVARDGVSNEIGDASKVASMLFGAAMGQTHLLALFGKPDEPRRARIAVRVDAALNAFGFAAGRCRNTGQRRSR